MISPGLDLVFLCEGRRGTKVRHVREVKASLLLEKYLQSKLLVPEESPMKSLSHIYSSGTRLFLVDDVGLIVKGVIKYEHMPDVHVAFWDKIMVGREYMCHSMAQLLAKDAEARGVWTAIPSSSRATLAFAKRVGFEEVHRSGHLVMLALELIT